MMDEVPEERPHSRREYSGPASTLGVAALIVLAVGLAIWFFEMRGPEGAGGEDSGQGIVDLPGELNPTGKKPAAEPGRAAPNFALHDLEGETVLLTGFRGRYVLLNFWASWCGPCRGETPDLQALQARAGGARFTVVGVNQQEPAGDARSFTRQFGVTYPVLLDRSGEVSNAYRVGRGLPVSMLVSPDGTVVRVYIGRVSAEDLEALEKEYLP